MSLRVGPVKRAFQLLHFLGAVLGLLLSLALISPAYAYQGKMKGARIASCGSAGCVTIESDTLHADTTGRILVGDAALVRWTDKAGREIRALRVLQPVVFLKDNVLMWEGEEDAPETAGTMDMTWGDIRRLGPTPKHVKRLKES